MDANTLIAQQIQSRLKSKCFELVKNEKGNHEIWKNDAALIGKKNENGVIDVLEGWVACSYCYMGYITHSKNNSNGKRKNFGLNGIHDHLKQCKSKLKNNLINNQVQNAQTTSGIQPKFAYNKSALPEKYKLKLKDAELKFVVAAGLPNLLI